MKWLRHLALPRVLAVLALVFALVPAWLAVVTYRDAREKDGRLFQTSAQVLSEQLQRSFEKHTYFLGIMRSHARELDDTALLQGRMAQAVDWKGKLPHLVAFGFAGIEEGRVVVRWKSEERAPVAALGEDITGQPGVAAAVRGPTMQGALPTFGRMGVGRRMLALLTILNLPVRTPRGFIAGWVDLDSLCRDSTVPLLRDGVLVATPVEESGQMPAGATRMAVSDGGAQWWVAIARGPRFSQEYGAPAPWLAFLAVGVSAVPLLVLAALAGRAGKLRAALAAEREVAEQQRFFTQSVSHEFRTPLGVILSGADLLDRYAEHITPERRAEVLAEIKDNTRQMTEMVEGVLLLGRIESSKLSCARQPVNIAALCREIARKNITAAPGSIAVSAPECDAMLDASLLGSVLGNLLSNAVKYSPAGSAVAFSGALGKDGVIFTVRDEGAGIPADELARVCDPFHRCKNVGETPGTGLGLAIARRCAELHGGTLKIESSVGSGTTATVSIPVA